MGLKFWVLGVCRCLSVFFRRAGKVVGLNEGRTCKVTNYQYVGQPWSACLHYRTQEYLEVLSSSRLRSRVFLSHIPSRNAALCT